MKRQTPKFNEKKAKAVILYLLSKGKMTKQKLTYMLYYLDFDYWEKFEEVFMGFTYQKTPNDIKALELDNLFKK
jgi:hypothetical protein